MFTIYSKPTCPQCEQAKNLLVANELPFTVVDIDVGQPKVDGQTYIGREEFLSTFPGQRSVPLVLQDGVRIGGFKELRDFLSTVTT